MNCSLMTTLHSSAGDADISVKQRLFVLWNLARRASEENLHIKEDIVTGKEFYVRQISLLNECLQSASQVSSRLLRGATASLLSKKREFTDTGQIFESPFKRCHI
ncbi:UNVERIFIED_CONTAM: hypothetical protein FKN15_062064 [Acipenser sinensis]